MPINIRNITNYFILIIPFSLSLWQFYLIPILFIKKLFIINKIDLLFIVISMPLIIYKFLNYELFIFFEYLRLNFSFFIFYLLFRNIKLNISHISIILISIHIIESIGLLLNIYDNSTLLGFSDTSFSLGQFEPGKSYGHTYRRPEGIFTNSTKSSIFYFLIFLMTNKRLLKYLLGICVITFFSGTGILLLVSTIFLSKKHFILKSCLLVIFILFSFNLNKISLTYILYNINYKYELLINHFQEVSILNLIVGNDELNYASDFGLEFFLHGYGIYGTLILLIFILLNVSKNNIKYMIYILAASTLHYPIIASALGALLFGYILSSKKGYNISKSIRKISRNKLTEET